MAVKVVSDFPNLILFSETGNKSKYLVRALVQTFSYANNLRARNARIAIENPTVLSHFAVVPEFDFFFRSKVAVYWRNAL
jgi:hypothetical protein